MDGKDGVPQSEVLVAHGPLNATLVSQPGATAVRAEFRPGIPGRNPQHSRFPLNLGNLKVGQT
jgi:hypothetical protein